MLYTLPSDHRSQHISFGANRPEELHEGVEYLCSVVTDLLTRQSSRNLYDVTSMRPEYLPLENHRQI